MGQAIFVPNIRFAGSDKVTLVGDTAPVELRIIAEDEYSDSSVQLSVGYTPVNAALRSVLWSVISGGEYASVDNNGKLTIDPSADEDTITVNVVSVADNTVYATKDITVTYVNPVTVLEKVTIRENPTINTHLTLFDENDSLEMKYRVLSPPYSSTGMLWGSVDERSSSYISAMTYVVTVLGADRSHDNTISSGEQHTYMTPTTIGETYVDEYEMQSYVRNGEPVAAYGVQSINEGFTPSGEIHILHPYYEYCFSEIEVFYFKFKRNGIVTHNFEAAVKNGVYGFYDAASDTFITNTGESGTITA